jgi:superfamily I DNA and/or RNA helicase
MKMHYINIFFENLNHLELKKVVLAFLSESIQSQSQLVNNIDSFLFGENTEVDLTYINLISNVLKDNSSKIDDIQSKIFIKIDTKSTSLSDIEIASDNLNYLFKNQNITLSRSQLEQIDNSKAIEVINNLHKLSISFNLPVELADKLFKFQSEAITVDTLINYASNIPHQKIKNIDQLWLITILSVENHIDPNDYFIKTKNENWIPFSGSFILPNDNNFKFYNEDYSLGDEYAKFFTKIENDYISYSPKSENDIENNRFNVIYSEFKYHSNCHTRIFAKNIESIVMLDYLFSIWEKNETKIGEYFILNNARAIIGIKPQESFINGIYTQKEFIPEYVLDWLNTDGNNKTAFLKYLGINHEYSYNKIVKLRKAIINKKFSEIMDIDFNKISPILLKNTLNAIYENSFIDNSIDNEFSMDNNCLESFEYMILRLLNDNVHIDFPVPCYLNNSSFSIERSNNSNIKLLPMELFNIIIENDLTNIVDKLYKYSKIIIPRESYYELFKNSFQEFSITFNFNEKHAYIEHDEPFYISWKQNTGIRLFQADKIMHKMYLNESNETHCIGDIAKSHIHYSTNTNSIYYDKTIHLDDLPNNISDESISENIQGLINSKNQALKRFYNYLNSNKDSSEGSELNEALKELFIEESKEEERNQIIENINNTEKYSYNWFIGYLKYLMSFEDIADNISHKSISFQKISSYKLNEKVSDKYFLLEGATSAIPVGIETFQDFSLKIVFKNNQTETIKVEGVSKKGQNLLMYIPNGMPSKITNNLNNIVVAKIEFSPVLDLLQRLYDSFKMEKYIQPWENVYDELPNLHFIYGPPGTGKTTKICNILNEAYKSNPNFKALILVPTNKGGDVIAKKLVSQASPVWFLRLGAPSDPELEDMDIDLYHPSLDEQTYSNCNAVISTIHRLPYYKVNAYSRPGFTLYDDGTAWDYVIFDESSMINLPYITFGLMSLKKSNPDTKFIIAGDPLQIPPVVDGTDKELEKFTIADDNIYHMLSINSFNPLYQNMRNGDTIENLQTQYRSVVPIGELFSDFSYDSLLKHGRNETEMPIKPLPDSFIASLKKPISFIDYPIERDNSILQPKKLLFSSYQIYVGILVSELIKYFSDCVTDSKSYSIGVISPYKAQAVLMNRLFSSYILPDNIDIQCDTVHGFQGDEKDIIVFVVNPNNHRFTNHPNSLLSKHYLYNVAISRAKDYLWIFHPFTNIPDNHFISNIHSKANKQSKVNMIKSSELEIEMFGSPTFLIDNSFVMGHDNINIFGQVDMKYFIKASETAIDIQMKK